MVKMEECEKTCLHLNVELCIFVRRSCKGCLITGMAVSCEWDML